MRIFSPIIKGEIISLIVALARALYLPPPSFPSACVCVCLRVPSPRLPVSPPSHLPLSLSPSLRFFPLFLAFCFSPLSLHLLSSATTLFSFPLLSNFLNILLDRPLFRYAEFSYPFFFPSPGI